MALASLLVQEKLGWHDQMPVPDGPTEGIFAKILFGWAILAVIFYVWSYVREGKFIGEDYFEDSQVQNVQNEKKHH